MNNEYELYPIKTFFLMWSNYTYIVIDKKTKSALVIDPAWELKKIVDKIYQLNVKIVDIFLTHSHYDHTNLVKPLIRMFNCNVYMSQKEVDYYHFRCSNLNAVNDKEKIRIGNTELLCLLTPGHTVGGMCYLLSDSLFTGDTIFIEGCGICNDADSAAQMFESIQSLKAQVSNHVRVYPGHSYGEIPGKMIEELTKKNIYFQINKKDCFINFRMRKNQKGLFDFK